MLMVFVIIGSLASIAIPHYADYTEKALAAKCQANRYHLEMEEQAYFIENDKTNMEIDDKYSCPSGGTYVWLVTDPDDPNYPQIGCSEHFMGSLPETSVTTPETEEDISPAQLIDDLISNVYNLSLSKKLTNSLTKKLNNALNNLEKGKSNKATNNLNDFVNTVKKQEKKKKIASEDADILISKAEEFQSIIGN
jgi:type II secretory pathway pseudopilin PulG